MAVESIQGFLDICTAGNVHSCDANNSKFNGQVEEPRSYSQKRCVWRAVTWDDFSIFAQALLSVNAHTTTTGNKSTASEYYCNTWNGWI